MIYAGCIHAQWTHPSPWMDPWPFVWFPDGCVHLIFAHNCLIGAVAVVWFMFATFIFGHNCLIGAVAVVWFMFAAPQFHVSLRTDYFAVNLPSLALHAPSRPNPAPRALPRLCQSVLSQFFPNAAMYLGELGSTGHLDQRHLWQFRQEHEEHRRIVELNACPELLSRRDGHGYGYGYKSVNPDPNPENPNPNPRVHGLFTGCPN
ncbi:hypothetical protein FB451DRAFT_1163904 [Mycena latifolia]|nr:hypothetical protein FB451DRAFT_1163904 [Mycena latifolia]